MSQVLHLVLCFFRVLLMFSCLMYLVLHVPNMKFLAFVDMLLYARSLRDGVHLGESRVRLR